MYLLLIQVLTLKLLRLSNWKFHPTLKDSLSNHLNTFIETGILLNPTSKKAIIANNSC